MGNKPINKKYFESIDDELCFQLKFHLENAKQQGLTEITLIEAIPMKSNDYIFCTVSDVVGDKSECNKKSCSLYRSKSGRGVCSHRGKLYEHGEEVTFKVE